MTAPVPISQAQNAARPPLGSPAEPVFPRAHKGALGFSVGLTLGGAIFALTAFHLILKPTEGLPIGLLGQYFYGYQLSWRGAIIGLIWGFGTGYVAGWTLGFVHNFTVTTWLLVVRARQELRQATNFFDHI